MSIEYQRSKPTVSNRKRTGYLVCKRVFDIVSSLAVMLMISPVLLVLAILVKIEDGGPVVYRQTRLGKNGKLIGIYKFRSMKVGADDLEKMLTPEQLEQYKREFKIDNDPRITRIGNVLRKTSLDELPQLWNIFVGDISVVGPRPIIPQEINVYPEEDRARFLSVVPGLTGYWQAYARNNATYESGKRQEMELYYVENASFWLDIKIILHTVVSVLTKAGAS